MNEPIKIFLREECKAVSIRLANRQRTGNHDSSNFDGPRLLAENLAAVGFFCFPSRIKIFSADCLQKFFC